jgi:Cdc6-like AAA superfamily ATPase
MTIMLKIFRKKNRNTKGIVEAQLAGAEAPAADASSSLSVPATFSNPFGLGRSESLVQPAFGDDSGSLQQGNARSEENGAPNVHAPPEDVAPEDIAPMTTRDEERDQPCECPVETVGSLAQAEQPETFADMQDNSTDRPFNPLASIWADAPGEAPSNEQNEASERQIESDLSAVSEDPDRNRREDAAPLIGAPGRAASGRGSKPRQADRGDQQTRLNLRASESVSRPAEKQPILAAGRENRHGTVEPEMELPKFAPVSSSPAPRDPSSSGAGETAVQTKLWEAFTPSRPKYSSRFFAGRRWALQRIITAVEQDQAHIVIYGPRGIGKTSLANVLAESASEVEYQVLRFPCGSNATFEEIFRGLLRSLPADHLDRATQARFSGVENLEQLLPEGEFGPTDLTAILSQIRLDHAILIIDEFDRVESKQLKNQLAEAIKNLSDASARVTFIVIGIAHSLDELIGMHPSIQRHLVGIHLPLMTESELEHVVLAGEDASGLRFEDATRDMVVAFSKGLPYYAQLLSLHAGRTALKRGSMLVQMADLRDALELVLIESDPLARSSYEAATRDETDQLLVDVLFAAATAPFNDYGTFTAKSAADMFVDSEGKKLPAAKIRKCLEDLAQQENARLIETWPVPTAETRYAFVLQTMRQYILLRQAVRRGLM